jgi:hypothetical protein
LSGYNWFFKEERKKVLNLDFQSMGREISARWKNITQSERKRFDDLAEKDAVRYKIEVQFYNEEQVLKARKERELHVSNISSKKGSSGGLKQSKSMDDTDPPMAVATVRAMEECYRPNAPQRMSPRLASIGVKTEIPVVQSLTDAVISRPHQLNLIILANEMHTKQHESLRKQLALETLRQTQSHLVTEQPNDPVALQQIQRQKEANALALFLAQKRTEAELDIQDSIVRELLWRRKQHQNQQQQQQQQHAPLNTFSRGANTAFPAGLGGIWLTGFLPSPLATPTMTPLQGTLQQSIPQSLPSLHDPRDQIRQDAEASFESMIRRMVETNRDGRQS